MFYKICIFSLCVLMCLQLSAQRSKSHLPKYRSHSTSSYATQQKIANEEKRKAEEAAAQQRRTEAEKQAKQAQALQKALEEQERLSFKIKTPKFAAQISQKAISISKTSPKTAALLAKEAYEMHKAIGGNMHTTPIYQGLLTSMLCLDPSFNHTQNAPNEATLGVSEIVYLDEDIAKLVNTFPSPQKNKKVDARSDYENKYAIVIYKNNLMQIFDVQNPKASPKMVTIWENSLNKDSFLIQFSLFGNYLSLAKDTTLLLCHLPSLFDPQMVDYEPIKIKSTHKFVKTAIIELDKVVMTLNSKGQWQFWALEMSTYVDIICDKVKGNLSDKSWLQYIGSDDPTNKVMYIKTPDGGRHTPVSTCSPKYPQLLDME